MKIKKTYQLCLLGLFLSMSQVLLAQEQDSITPLATIPFELTSHNNLAIQGVFNQTDTVSLMFHTAAGSITLIEEASEKMSSITWDQEEEVNSWGGASSARYSKSNFLEIENLKWDSLAIWENKNSGPTTDGKFGPHLFQDQVIEIDFDKKVMLIYATLPGKIVEYQKMELMGEDGFMFIEGTSTIQGVEYKNRFLIHSGYGGTILYDDQFVAESEIGKHIEITAEKELKDSYGNVLKTKKGKLPQFVIGDAVFEDIPVGFFEGSIGRQKMSVIGGNLLKRFNLIIDAKQEFIYLKSNQLTQLGFGDS